MIDGHRIIEIGCIELLKRQKTGRYFHTYINPDRSVDPGAYAVHGISDNFLSDKPKFEEIVKDFINFIEDSQLIIHNAPFDLQFLNHELRLLGLEKIESANVTDTLMLARKKYPGAPASLDALCKRFSVNADAREKHGALLDADLLASVYVTMCGTVQSSIDFKNEIYDAIQRTADARDECKIRRVEISDREKEEHNKLVAKLKNPLWNKSIA